MTRKWAAALGVCAVIGVIAVVLFLRSSDRSDPAPGPTTTPEPTLWIDSEFG